jgi:hypothetical protein
MSKYYKQTEKGHTMRCYEDNEEGILALQRDAAKSQVQSSITLDCADKDILPDFESVCFLLKMCDKYKIKAVRVNDSSVMILKGSLLHLEEIQFQMGFDGNP